MKKPLKECVNGDGRPVQPPSWVLCKECLEALSVKMHDLLRELKAAAREKAVKP